MRQALAVLRNVLSLLHPQRNAGGPARRVLIRDPELLEIAEIADRRQERVDEDLERIFEKVRPILHGRDMGAPPVRRLDLPASIRTKISEISDAEQKINTIVEFRMSARMRRAEP